MEDKFEEHELWCESLNAFFVCCLVIDENKD